MNMFKELQDPIFQEIVQMSNPVDQVTHLYSMRVRQSRFVPDRLSYGANMQAALGEESFENDAHHVRYER